jgi:hypothetical protein
MKTLLWAILSLSFATSVVALPQDAPSQAPRKTQADVGAGLTNIMGTVQGFGLKVRVTRSP